MSKTCRSCPPTSPGTGPPPRPPPPLQGPLRRPHPQPARHSLHGLEQRLPVVLERHDELELRAPRLHGCGEAERQRHRPPRRGRLPTDPVACAPAAARGPSPGKCGAPHGAADTPAPSWAPSWAPSSSRLGRPCPPRQAAAVQRRLELCPLEAAAVSRPDHAQLPGALAAPRVGRGRAAPSLAPAGRAWGWSG